MHGEIHCGEGAACKELLEGKSTACMVWQTTCSYVVGTITMHRWLIRYSILRQFPKSSLAPSLIWWCVIFIEVGD